MSRPHGRAVRKSWRAKFPEHAPSDCQQPISPIWKGRTHLRAALTDFLLPGSPSDTLEAGFAVRRKVLGDAHVDRAIARHPDFTREFQAMITRYAWGTVWTRPGLNERTRRLLVMATAAALGRWEEFRLHVSSALDDGIEPSEIKEVLLQTAIYAGVPAANTGFHIAQEEIDKPGSSRDVSSATSLSFILPRTIWRW